jgi:hypothetical protein
MTRIFVKPALDKSAGAQPGARLKVRKPVGGHLAEAGEWQNLDSYWQRRINDTDVEVVQGLTEEAPAAQSDASTAAAPGAADTGASKAGTMSKTK